MLTSTTSSFCTPCPTFVFLVSGSWLCTAYCHCSPTPLADVKRHYFVGKGDMTPILPTVWTGCLSDGINSTNQQSWILFLLRNHHLSLLTHVKGEQVSVTKEKRKNGMGRHISQCHKGPGMGSRHHFHSAADLCCLSHRVPWYCLGFRRGGEGIIATYADPRSAMPSCPALPLWPGRTLLSSSVFWRVPGTNV